MTQQNQRKSKGQTPADPAKAPDDDGGPGSHNEDGSGGVTNDPASGGTSADTAEQS